MKHIFIINPMSGKGKVLGKIKPEIEQYAKEHPELDIEIHITTAAYEAITFVSETAKSGEHIRFYACGGDGTLFEVVNGAYQYNNAEVAVIPLGSGNDFIRLFGKADDFKNIDVHINGTPISLDLIRCGDKVAINQCSMGVDAEVCAKQAYFKKLPFVSGEAAYTFSLLYCLCKKLKSEFKVYVDDEFVLEDTMLFSLCGNSRWYGGGYKGAPLAIPDDGLLDMILVKKTVGRLKLAGLMNKYKRGEHLDWPMTTFMRGKKLHIVSKKPAAVNVDGECEYVTESTFEIIEKGIKFVVPSNSTYFDDRKSGKISPDGAVSPKILIHK